MHETICDACGQIIAPHNIVFYKSESNDYRPLCNRCVNTKVARRAGLETFEDLEFQPVVLSDVQGENHTFHFRTRLFGTGVALDAFELQDGDPFGYQFQVIGEPEADLLALLGKLIEKIRRGISVKYIEETAYGPQIVDSPGAKTRILGMIESDPDCPNDRVPRMVIDGREITWTELGRMLMTYEGWQFKLEIFDKADDP
jgi:hypothetical protein